MGLMEGLSGWLKQVVAVVLLAGLVDLLLPNRTMQRYVRLVAGLFILLTIATPLLQWIRSDFGNRLATDLNSMEVKPQAAAELSRIQAAGRKWKERQQEEAAGVMASRLQEAIRTDVEQNEGYQVSEVKVQVQQTADGLYSVQDVIVTLSAQPAALAGSSQGPKPMADVQPVAPVTVDVSPESRPSRSQPSEDPTDRQTRSRIAALIVARYGIPEGRVQVVQSEPTDIRR